MFQSTSRFDCSKYYNLPHLHLSEKAIEYFTTLDALVEDENAVVSPCFLPDKMIEGFRRFTKSEKVRYLTENLKYLDSVGENKNCYEASNTLAKEFKTIEADCQVRSLLCFYRKTTKIKLETQSRTLLLNQATNIRMIDLQNYLVHAEKKMFKNKIYLEPVISSLKSWAEVKRYQFTLSYKQFTRIYDSLFNCVMDIRNEELISLFTKSQEGLKWQTLNVGHLTEKTINKKQYELFFKQKSDLLNEYGVSHFQFDRAVYTQEKKGNKITIKTIEQRPTIFKASIRTNEDIYIAKSLILKALEQNKNHLLVQSEVLQSYEDSDYNCIALYQKYYLGQTPHSTIYMREILSVTDLLLTNSIKSIISIEEKKRYDDFIFMKSVDSPLVTSFFRYIFVFVNEVHPSEKQDKSKAEIAIVGDFYISPLFTTQMAIEFLREYYYSIFNIERVEKVDLIKKDSFRASNMQVQTRMTEAINIDEVQKKKDMQEDNKNQEIIVDFAEPESATRFSRFKFIEENKGDTQKDEKSKLFFQHRFGLKPQDSFNIEQDTVSQNFMKKEWVRGEDGGLICVNQKLLVEHKKIFKHILASIGTNILKGGNILNVSLPVTIFKKEGHLQMVADSFSLSPKLLQNVKSPLERMKKAVLVSVSVGTLGISVEKPFFPTLGETLQVWIAGCPMYMEQILRYPPTGAYLFYGRGYRIYGQVQPKISFGINGGKGYSERPSYIQFDDGQKIQLSYGKLVISGIFVGDRQFNFYDKAFAYDKQNNYFAEIIFGARDTQVFGKNKQKKDFLYGKIYELIPQFADQFQKAEPPKPYPTKKHIKAILSEFQGHWNGIIEFDKVQYINYLTDLPSKVQAEQYCLPSDTRHRKDLKNLLKDNIQEAQRQKQIIQEAQRRDRKLRAEKKKQNK